MATRRKRRVVLMVPSGSAASDWLPQINSTATRYPDATLLVDGDKIVLTTAQPPEASSP